MILHINQEDKILINSIIGVFDIQKIKDSKINKKSIKLFDSKERTLIITENKNYYTQTTLDAIKGKIK